MTTLEDVVDPGDGLLSLREAITLANATAVPDTIVLSAGVYEISIPGAAENGNATGDFDITNPLSILGTGATSTFVDGAQQDRVFEVIGDFDVRFDKVTIHNGFGPFGFSVFLFGGGISANGADITLIDSAVSGNGATGGGGISTYSGNITLIRSIVSDNVVEDGAPNAAGGGIFTSRGNVTLVRSTVSGN